jgi:DNA-binding transcriptional regulator YdaS (Cro superfamily)
MRVGERLREWLVKAGETQDVFSTRAGLSRTNLYFVLTNQRRCSRANAEAISRATNGDISADELERQYDETPVTPRVKREDETPPVSEERPLPRELGNTRDELRMTVQEIDAVRRKGGLTPNQDAALLGKRTSALTALARQEDRSALEDHPDFEAFTDDALRALEATLAQYGVDVTGARSVFAAHLERIEAERQRRAA